MLLNYEFNTTAVQSHISVMSQWARWRLKSLASILLTQPFVQAQIKENTKDPLHWPLWGEFNGDREFTIFTNRPVSHFPGLHSADDIICGLVLLNYEFNTTAVQSHITVMSQWARCRLKSLASLLLTRLFVQAQIKENTEYPRHWPLWGEFTGDRWIPHTKGQ